MIALYIVGIMWVCYMIYGVIDAGKNIKARKAYEEEIGRKVSNKEWRAYRREEAKLKKEASKAKSKAVKTAILDHTSGDIKGGGGSIGRAVVGGAIAGSVGAVVGANTGKKKYTQEQYTVFKVWYADGHTDIEKVSHKAQKYKEYLNLIQD